MLQARHVRPSLARRGELRVACTGLFASFFAFALLATLPIPDIRGSTTAPTIILYTAASALAYTSATVVTGLTAAAATCCDEDVQSGDETLKRGRALGGFRSKVCSLFRSPQVETDTILTGPTWSSCGATPRMFFLLALRPIGMLRRHGVLHRDTGVVTPIKTKR